jgi:hypothetical protein
MGGVTAVPVSTLRWEVKVWVLALSVVRMDTSLDSVPTSRLLQDQETSHDLKDSRTIPTARSTM